MATFDECEEALVSAIKSLAERAVADKGSEYALNHAAAANQLAEARAWLVSVAQPHGGASIKHS